MTLGSSRVTARQGGNLPLHLVETAEAECGGEENIKIIFREFREYSYLFLLSCDNLKWLSSPTFFGSAPWHDKLVGWPVPGEVMMRCRLLWPHSPCHHHHHLPPAPAPASADQAHLSPGVSLISDLAHDSGILQSELLAADSSSSSPKVVVVCCLLFVGSQVEKSLLTAT